MAKRDPAKPRPPAGAHRHRRWRVYYEFGVIESGACVLETGWYAVSPGGDIIESRGWNGVLAGIDDVERGRGTVRPDDPPTPFIEGRATPPYSFWIPDPRRS